MFAIIVLIAIRRIYRNWIGVLVSPVRTIGYTIFYFAFGALFIAPSFFEGVSVYYLVPEALLAIVGGLLSHRLADKRLHFWRSSNGSVFYKGAIIVYVIYLAGLVSRVAVELYFIGPSAFTFSSSVALSQTAILGTAVAGLLLTFGIGLLVGRNIRVYQRYNSITRGKEIIGTT